jgi:UDP-glucose 4-epimerase
VTFRLAPSRISIETEEQVNFRDVKVLVTGADGFIGSHLTELLVDEGAAVTALALYNSFDQHGWLDDLSDAVRSRIEIVRGDVRDASFVRGLVRGHEIVFHLAALIAIPFSYVAARSYVDTNVVGTLNMLEAAREYGVRRFVHTSTSEVYGTAITMPIDEEHPLQGQSPYSASKIGADMMAEAFTRSFALPIVILRPFNTFGPRQSERAVIPTIIRQAIDPCCEAISIGDTATVRDFSYVEDTARAFLAIASAPDIAHGVPYNAGSGIALSIEDIIVSLRDITGCTKPLRRDPERQRPDLSEVRALLANSARLQRQTDWKPRVGLLEGLERTVAWWRARLACGAMRRDARFII